MKKILIAIYIGVFALMLYGTIQASLYQNIMDAISELGSHPWFQVTILDTYFAFLTVFLWIAYKEASLIKGLLWLVLVAGLGSFAIAAYILWQVIKLKDNFSIENLLLRKS